MKTVNWAFEELRCRTVTNRENMIIEMNQKAADLFSKMVAKPDRKDLLDCHSHLSQEKIRKTRQQKLQQSTPSEKWIKKNGFLAPTSKTAGMRDWWRKVSNYAESHISPGYA
jgi:hypothetical protein